jgi:predicted nucleic acid-binding protein
MPDRVFLDSNVVVYAHSLTEPGKREIARSIPANYDTVVSTQVLSELGNVFTRKLRIEPSEARRRIASFVEGCEVITLTESIILDAFRIAEKYRYGFYDSQIVAAALMSGADVLYSEDMQHGQIIESTLTILSPFRMETHQTRGAYRVRRRVKSPAGKRTAR